MKGFKLNKGRFTAAFQYFGRGLAVVSGAIKAIIMGFFEDIMIFTGLGFIVFATFVLSTVAGFYCLGACLFGLGVWFTRHPIKKG